jgi:timeless
VDEALWTVLSKTLGSLLKKDWDERLEDDKLIIERILILVRNVLQVPTNVRREGRTMDDVSLHDQVLLHLLLLLLQVLWVLHQAGMQDLLLYIASSDSEAAYCLHVLETISLIFREQDPASLASANFSRSKEEKSSDEVPLPFTKLTNMICKTHKYYLQAALEAARRQEAERAKSRARLAATSRHSRFGGTFVLKNVKSITDRELIVQKPLQNLQDLNFDEKKRGVKKSKNKLTPTDTEGTHRSTLPVRIFLKEFCVEFLLSAYNQLMGVVRDALNRQKAQQNDETYYLWCIR